jgi:membrane associated rhomboid family serine protease
VQASVGSHCVECARAARPDATTRVRYWSARQPTLVTYALIAINIAVFVWIGIQYPETIAGELPQTLDNPQFDIGLNNIFLERNGEWYRLLTTGFLHFGIIHLAFNMLLLFQLGQLLEPEIGRIRFALLYFAALLAGSAGVVLLDPAGLTGGASGAVFGLMGAAFIGLRNRGINPMTTGLGTTLLINLLLTFTISGISIGGHIGGLVGGAAAGWVVLAPPYRRLPAWMSYAAPVAVMVVSVAISVVAINA